MGKITARPPPGVYRDEPDRDDAASASSAVLLEEIDYSDDADLPPDAELPAYEDVASVSSTPTVRPAVDIGEQSYLIQPELSRSHLSRDEVTTTTQCPLYSQDAEFLRNMLADQAKYPPTWTVRIAGTHSETSRKKDKTEKQTVVDFDVLLDMTHLLVQGASAPRSLCRPGFAVAEPQVKAFRGDRTKTAANPENALDAAAYIQSYISSPYPVRSFVLDRQIIHHDSLALENFLKSLVGSTNYRGHLRVSFPITRRKVQVLSPCWQNNFRSNIYIRWFFYLTFLWLFSWPYLWFVTHHWEVLSKQFPYACCLENCGNRKFMTQSEEAFYKEWKASIRRAVLGKKQGWIDEEYKLQTGEMARGVGGAGLGRMPSTGHAGVDGALGFLQQTVTVERVVAMAGGWGADS